MLFITGIIKDTQVIELIGIVEFIEIIEIIENINIIQLSKLSKILISGYRLCPLSNIENYR